MSPITLGPSIPNLKTNGLSNAFQNPTHNPAIHCHSETPHSETPPADASHTGASRTAPPPLASPKAHAANVITATHRPANSHMQAP